MPSMGRISIHASPELQALRQRLSTVDAEVRSQVSRFTKSEAAPIWTAEVDRRAHTELDRKVLASTAKVAVSARNVTLRAASTTKRLRGGLRIGDQWQGIEFGANDPEGHTGQPFQQRSRRGTVYTVKGRHNMRQLPPRYRHGRLVYPAARVAIPRIAALWVQTTVRTLHEAIEG